MDALVRERLGRTHQAEQIDALRPAHARCGGALEAEHDDRVAPVLRRRIGGQPALHPLERGRAVLGLVELADGIAIPALGGGPPRGLLLIDELAELRGAARDVAALDLRLRSEEHTSELQSLMRTSYAVFCLKKKN